MHVCDIFAVCIEIFRKSNKKPLIVVACGKEVWGGVGNGWLAVSFIFLGFLKCLPLQQKRKQYIVAVRPPLSELSHLYCAITPEWRPQPPCRLCGCVLTTGVLRSRWAFRISGTKKIWGLGDSVTSWKEPASPRTICYLGKPTWTMGEKETAMGWAH